jgi:DNA-binding CsgD family transcriptional regulator
MHLSSTQSRALGEIMCLLADATDGDALREALALPMFDLLGADQYVSMVWDAQISRFGRNAVLNVSASSLRQWDAYYRFVDPLTFPMMERRRPTVATQILTQPALSRTEFFNDFLRREHMHWGVNVYFYDQAACVGDMRIWRKPERGNFEPNEVELLRMVEPAIAAALGRLHWVQGSAPPPRITESAEELLQRHARLSQREAEVAWLVACGCPDKQIARRLAVGHPTVRFHLANAFRKLQADNRTALAARVQSIVDARRAETKQPPGFAALRQPPSLASRERGAPSGPAKPVPRVPWDGAAPMGHTAVN